MKNIPEKYYKEENQREALANLRRCLASGMTVKDIAKQLTSKYEHASDSQKKHIGKLLASVYDFESRTTAKACALLFSIKMLNSLSVGESAYIDGYEDSDMVSFKKMYSLEVIGGMGEVFDNYQGGRSRILSPASNSNVLTISKDDNIYAVIHSKGNMSIFIVESCDTDILVDEESFMSEAPLYFTESTHFVSPVFKIKQVKSIFDYCLKEIGYPAISVNQKVIFADMRANLINRSEYVGEVADRDDWNGIDVIMYKEIVPDYPISDICDLEYDYCENELKLQLRCQLIHSVGATAKIYNSICKDNKMLKLTPTILSKLCKKNNIFFN